MGKGMIVGLSTVPTRYRMMTAEGEAYVRCGADLLLNGLGSDLEAEAQCPVCNSPIRFRIRQAQILGLHPEESLLHVVEVLAGPGRIGIECEATHLFDKEDCLRHWISGYTGRHGATFLLDEYMGRLKNRLQSRRSS